MLEEILLLDESRDGDRPKVYHLSVLVVAMESCVGDLYQVPSQLSYWHISSQA